MLRSVTEIISYIKAVETIDQYRAAKRALARFPAAEVMPAVDALIDAQCRLRRAGEAVVATPGVPAGANVAA